MKDERKTKEELSKELNQLRRKVSRFEKSLQAQKASKATSPGIAAEESTVLDSISEHIIYQNLDMRVLWANKAAADSVELKVEDLIGRCCYDIWNQRDDPCPGCPVKKAMDTASPHTAEMTSADNRIWLIRGDPVFDEKEKVKGAVEIASEITDRKRAEEGLRESEERYRIFVQNFHGIAYQGNIDFMPVFFHGDVHEITGYKEEEFISGRPRWDEIIHPEDFEKIQESVEKIRVSPRYSTEREYRIVRKDGEERWVHEFIQNMCDESGRPSSVQGSIYDITERKLIERELENASEEWRRTFDTIPDFILIIDSDFVVRKANKAILKLLGLSFEDIAGKKCFNLIHGADYPPEYCPHKATMSDLKERTIEIFEPGFDSYFLVTTTPMKDDAGNVIGSVHIMRDTTEVKKMEDHLQKAEKLESLGILAGGIAHDFNNILTAILGNIQLAGMNSESKEEFNVSLTEAEKACFRAKDLTDQLLTFSRGGTPIKKTSSIADLVRESANFALRGSNVRCVFSFPEDLWLVDVDTGQMSQVINNLIINADQAMPEGGTMDIFAENVEIEEEGVTGLRQGKYVNISIRDRGVGIPQGHLSRIFDPYFTTKQKGSGLGLTTSYSIISRHDGHIAVESEMGAGTTFNIWLPASEKKALDEEPDWEEHVKGSGRILFMDDEKNIRRFVKNMLEQMGYEVQLASDGAEAVELYRKALEEGRRYDAVIMDLTVPGGMGGKQAVRELLKIDLGVKAIVSSGYSTDPIMAEYKRYGFRRVIEKPYRIKDLNEVLKKSIKE